MESQTHLRSVAPFSTPQSLRLLTPRRGKPCSLPLNPPQILKRLSQLSESKTEVQMISNEVHVG